MRVPSAPALLLACQLGLVASQEAIHETLQRSLEERTWARNFQRADGGLGGLLSDLDTCGGCMNILTILKGIVGTSDTALASLGIPLCTQGTDYDEQFCSGTVAREAPSISDIIRNVGTNTSTALQFCITFLGVCKEPDVEELTVDFPSKRPCIDALDRPKPSSKKPIQVIQYSDVHIDPLYEKGADTKCKKAVCCRNFGNGTLPTNITSPAGPFGDHNCDAPESLEINMYKAIQDMFPDAAFTMFTGDIVDHGLYNTSQPYNENLINKTYENMNDHLKLVYGTAGNHESSPVNIFEPNAVGNATQWVYDTLADQWSRWIGNATSEVRDIGAYSVKYAKGNLRIISLNTNMYYRFNFAMYQKEFEEDPNGQIAWFVKELDAAEKAGENVYVMGHMPLGEQDALPVYSNALDRVVKRYSATIKAMFFGHTHVDHFEISYSDYSKREYSNALAVSYICPSLTPTSGMPSFRVYDVDPDTFAVLDATTYMADMSDKDFQTKGPKWTKYYSAKETYGSLLSPPVKDQEVELTPAFWHNVTTVFEKSHDAFNDYMARKSRGWNVTTNCTDECKTEEICQLRAGRSQDNCYVVKPGVHFSKRDIDPEPVNMHHHHGKFDSCDGSVMAEVLSAMVRREDLLEMVQDHVLKRGIKLEPFFYKRDIKPRATATQTQDDSCTPTTKGGANATGSGGATDEASSGATAIAPAGLLLAAMITFLL